MIEMKLVSQFDDKDGLRVGDKLKIDKIAYDETHAMNFKVRVVGFWKRPTYISIAWFFKAPNEPLRIS